MNFQARMYNRKASDPKSKPNQILDTLALQPGQNVADIGAGGGYFSLRFAEAVGDEAHVFAIEIDPELVEFIRQAAKEKRLTNVDTILVTENQLALPQRSLDLVFMRNVTHDIGN